MSSHLSLLVDIQMGRVAPKDTLIVLVTKMLVYSLISLFYGTVADFGGTRDLVGWKEESFKKAVKVLRDEWRFHTIMRGIR